MKTKRAKVYKMVNDRKFVFHEGIVLDETNCFAKIYDRHSRYDFEDSAQWYPKFGKIMWVEQK